MKLFQDIGEKLGRIGVYSGIFIIPLFVLQIFRNGVDYPKILFLSTLNILILLFWAFGVYREKNLYLRSSTIQKTVLLFLLVNIFISFFSLQIFRSYVVEPNVFVLNVFILFQLVFWFVLLTHHIHKISQWKWSVYSLLVSDAVFLLGIMIIFFFFRENNFWSSILDSPSIPFWIGTLGLFAIGLAGKRDMRMKERIFLSVVAFFSVILFCLLSPTSPVMILMTLGLLLLLTFGFMYFRNIRQVYLIVWFVLLLSCLFSFVFVKMDWTLLEHAGQAPQTSTLSLVKNTLTHHLTRGFVGYGHGNFSSVYGLYRGMEENYSIHWLEKYTFASNTFFQMFFEQGVFGILSFLLIVILTIGLFVGSCIRTKGESILDKTKQFLNKGSDVIQYETHMIGIVWFLTTLYIVFGSVGFVEWWLWFTLLGLFVIGLYTIMPNIMKEKIYTFSWNNEYSFVILFGTLLIFCVFIAGQFFFFRQASAEYVFTKAERNTVLEESILQNHTAITLSSRPEYTRALAQRYLQLTRMESQKEKPDSNTIIAHLAKAVELAKTATEKDPSESQNWEVLATLYLNSRPVGVENANDWLILTLDEAILRDPVNPVLQWRMAGAYVYRKEEATAEKYLRDAITLKTDYVQAYLDLAEIYAKREDYNKAVEIFAPIFANIQDNPQALYRLASYAFNRNYEGDRKQAEQVWLRVLQLEPNHANASFGLGVYYDEIGDSINAEKYYRLALKLDPQNEEIKERLEKL
ncbi:MAG: hypothetical protein V1848_02105 [Candidatus Magasanikbacteria bacterium]